MKKNKEEKDRVHQESSKFLYVGVGASAGGLDALKRFLSNIPQGNGMAYIIVQHMDPTQKSGLVNILSRSTYMEVKQIEDGSKVMPEHVYVIPPNKDLGILKGKLQLMEPTEPHGLRLPIDYFFTSLGQDQKDKSVGIILSGFGSDGSNGLKAIKANGGICIAQDPSTAGSGGMPNSAINTRLVDMVLTPEEMSEKLISYNGSSSKILKEILSPEDGTLQALRKIFILIRNRTGQDFSQYKKNTINRRIGRRMNIHQIRDITQYLRYLQQNPNEIDQLYNEFLINVTNFFRDPEAFESLKNGALMGMIEGKNDGEIIRVWVPGCSSGEEIYSIAIIMKELIDGKGKHLEVQIFGTDLDENAIKTARSGTYSNIAKEMTPERLKNFFYKKDGLYTIKKEIRDMVIFSIHNVITDPPFTQLDFISCRNLLIYLEVKAQEKVISNFRYALKKDGILFIGPSENIGDFFDSFSVLENKWKIYKSVQSNSMRFNHVPIRPTNYQQTPAYEDTRFRLKNPNQENNKMNIVDIAEENLIDIYAPPSAVINKVGDILYIHGRLGKYLEPSEGKAHMNILDMQERV
jgi:two-component system CheB/CheR fusion protein